MPSLNLTPFEMAGHLEHLLRAGLAPLLVGPPGIGKTGIVEQAAERLGFDLVVSHPATSDPTDFRGLPIVADGRAEFSPFAQLRALVEATAPTVWFLDDLGQAPTLVQAALMQLIHPNGRRLNDVQISDNVRIVAATNRAEDGAGVRGVLTPLVSRFHTIVNIAPDLDTWCQWAFDAHIDPMIPAFLLYTRDDHPLGGAPMFSTERPSASTISAFPSPRSWHHVSQLLEALPVDIHDHELLPLLTGCVGEEAAAAFVGFRASHQDVVHADEIARDPSGVAIPKDPAVLYLTLAHLGRTLERAIAAPAAQFLERLTPEMVSLFLAILPNDKKTFGPITRLVARYAPTLA